MYMPRWLSWRTARLLYRYLMVELPSPPGTPFLQLLFLSLHRKSRHGSAFGGKQGLNLGCCVQDLSIRRATSQPFDVVLAALGQEQPSSDRASTLLNPDPGEGGDTAA